MSRVFACRHCSTSLNVPERFTDRTFLCPHCLGEVNNPWPGSSVQAPELDTDVKRDLSVGSWVLAILIGICVLGVLLTLFAPRGSETYEIEKAIWLMCAFAVLDVLVSIALIRRIVRVGTAGVHSVSVGRVIGLVLLSLGTVVAVVAFFFATCFVMIR